MKAIVAFGLLLSSIVSASPVVVVKKPLAEENTVSVTVFGAYASKHTPFYTRVFKQGNLSNSYYPSEIPFETLGRIIPCLLEDLSYEACRARVPQGDIFEELGPELVKLLTTCAPRLREFEMIDFKVNPEKNAISEVRLPTSCGSLASGL